MENQKKAILLSQVLGKEKLDDVVNFFGYLYRRWLDERKYEDFKEYKEAFEKKLGIKTCKFNKKPFQAEFLIDNQKYFIRCAYGNINWGRYAS